MLMKLTVELVPKTSFCNNLRKVLDRKEWDRLREETYNAAGHLCEVCGGKGRKHPVECHEIWKYNDKKKIQKLAGLIALCPRCHECKHLGFAELRGKLPGALKHLARVNDWTSDETEKYAVRCFDTWLERSKHPWELDLSWLERGNAQKRTT